MRRGRPKLGRQAWLEAARQALIEEGTAGVEINKLARRLGTSRSVFYWLFSDRAHLLAELLGYWVRTSTDIFERAVGIPGRSGIEQYRALVDLWVQERDYDPKWDGAVRDWARTSKRVREAVQKVDAVRIALIEGMFRNMGYRGNDAHIRARVMYYHQVGYYALGVRESFKERQALLPYYQRILAPQAD
jgi:AcrR family transcriptional regulator